MRFAIISVIAAAGLSAALLSCGDDDPTCVAVDRPALLVEIRDSATSLPAAMGAIVVAISGESVDSVTSTNQLTVPVGKGGGLFTVRVRQQGYALWTRTNVQVPGSDCLADVTVPLVVRLQH